MRKLSVLRALLSFEDHHYEVAQAVGMSPDVLSRLQNGRVDRPNRDDLQKLAEHFSEKYEREIDCDILTNTLTAHQIVDAALRRRKLVLKGPE